jgi:hypothetical protein
VSGDEGPRGWSLVLKVRAPARAFEDPKDAFYWKREPLLYRDGLLEDLPGVRAPRCFGHSEGEDGTAWLWLEDVAEQDEERRWTIERWALAARHLGRFNGAYAAGRTLPVAPYLGGGMLRSSLEWHRGLVEQIRAAPENPALRQWWPRSIVDDLMGLWEERAAFCDALERLPQTFCHGDAMRRNLLSRRLPGGEVETAAVDWERAGYWAVGEEVGQTLSVAAAFYHLEPGDLPALDEAMFESYLDGLREAGWQGDARAVRFAYAAHAALRNAFNAVGASVPEAARFEGIRRNHGRSWEELAERRAEIRPFLLERAREARKLLAEL